MTSVAPRIIGVADNYPKDTPQAKQPLVFLKDSRVLYGDGDLVHLPEASDRYWGEPELGLVIAGQGFQIPAGKALDYVAGYVIVNDVTREGARDADHHLMYSKAFAGSCVLGPAAPRDFDIEAVGIRGFHNGELIREGTLVDRIFDDATLISWLSSWFELVEGDIISTGAPARVRSRLYLQEGDEFVCEINGIGRLTNRFSFHRAS